ncbi:DUF6498-containing protein [Phycicoccus sonneratiae]|uniref:Uncharacterized protein n=1 Tax=Phycicoccus sonneratiae TaxID=2807628 RepID=A0ABS2CPR1_9MICO|nr:DUF6498-containing protein [Phycicoccus sonneraticus]MBM6401866.1 hypothetical protein [Phycicoccus sonneraticus]
MNVLLSGLGRVLGLRLVLRLTEGMEPRRARQLLAATVVVVNGAPVLAVLSGAIGYGDVWLWLALEVVTIYLWTLLRGLLAPSTGSRFAVAFFGFHYGMFALVPFLVGLFTVLPTAPLRSPVLTVVLLGGIGFLAAGWSMAGRLRARAPLSVGDWVRAYARMALAYAALFLPLVGQREDGDLTRLGSRLELTLAVGVLVAKGLLELALVVGIERRADGRAYVLGRPVVVTVRRST